MHDFAKRPRGLVLVTGPTGSGKSTTLAAVIDEINRTRSDHIMTIEDPIEFLHRHKKCMVNQREIGPDAISFAEALRGALRQDPDVILLGEMRDLETIATALTAAETGHLVFATLHTQDAPATIDRVIDVFPAAQQGQVRVQLAATIQGDRHADAAADGRRAQARRRARDPDPRRRGPQPDPPGEDRADLLGDADRTRKRGMQTLEQSLAELVSTGKVTTEVALNSSSRPDQLLGLLQRSGSHRSRPTSTAASGPRERRPWRARSSD